MRLNCRDHHHFSTVDQKQDKLIHAGIYDHVRTIRESCYCSSRHSLIEAPSQRASHHHWAVGGKERKKDPAIMSHLPNMYCRGTACAAWSTPCQPPAVNALNITHSRSPYKVCESRWKEWRGERWRGGGQRREEELEEEGTQAGREQEENI